jgi:N-acetylglutamate synthase-like GNAT family acetyltransferase
MTDLFTRTATLADLPYIDALQKKNAECLAFYPRSALEREIDNHRVLICGLHNDPCGYLWHGAFGEKCSIHQACIQYDARGRLFGAHMVGTFVAACQTANVQEIALRCGSDINANGFWPIMGFHCIGVSPGGVRRMRDINHWRMNLQPALFSAAVVPSNKQKSAAAWGKRGEVSSSRFARGRSLLAYREQIT